MRASESLLQKEGESGLLGMVLLWFPLASETFIFREISWLASHGIKIMVYTMYGRNLKGCSKQMLEYPGPIRRMGIGAVLPILCAFLCYLALKPGIVWKLMRRGLFRKMRNAEALAENIWCFMAGFLLARYCKKDGVRHLHAPWANGPATAAWVAAALTGIPFSFAGRAGDIYPQDGILPEKARDAVFIRVNNKANIAWLENFCPADEKDKIRLVYNCHIFKFLDSASARAMHSPWKVLAVGRFARTKGFPDLLTAMARLKRENVPARLTLVGDGGWRRKLLGQIRRLHLEDCVDMPGFVPNDRLAQMMAEHDVLVMPSVVHSNGDRDGIPNVIMEALSQGLPVIATDVCGIGEVIEDGRTGLLVPQRNPKVLAQAIRRLFSNWPQALVMTQEGKKRVAQMFAPDVNGEKLCRLFQSYLSDA